MGNLVKKKEDSLDTHWPNSTTPQEKLKGSLQSSAPSTGVMQHSTMDSIFEFIFHIIYGYRMVYLLNETSTFAVFNEV